MKITQKYRQKHAESKQADTLENATKQHWKMSTWSESC